MDYILQEITDLVNFSLQYGQFLRKWKTSIVRPMIKKMSSHNLDLSFQNFRPINNVNFLSKVLEKIAVNQLMKHCDSLMLDYQSAYRKFYSCETVLVKLVNDILWAMEHQKILSLVCIDLSAAFDTVDHEILEQVLKNEYRINGTVLQWYKTYIRPRGFKVHEEYSDEIELPFAVAQGSCTGPYLFVLYCSTIKYKVPRTISLLGYSDDHALKDTFNAKNRDDENRCVGEMEDCLKDVNTWMCKNKLKMNNGKREFIYFGSRQMLSLCEREKIDVQGTKINRSNSVRYLRALLDSELNLKKHVTTICAKAMNSINRIRLIRNSLSKEVCQTIVQSLVISHLDYANAILIDLPDITMKKLQRVQNIAARLVLGNESREENSKENLKKLHWLPVKYRVEFKITFLVHRCIQNQAPDYLRNLLISLPVRRIGLRSERSNTYNLTIPKVKRETFAARAFSVKGPLLWNWLPNSIKTTEDFKSFTKQLKHFTLKKPIVNNEYYLT